MDLKDKTPQELAAIIDRLEAENAGLIPEAERLELEDAITNRAWTYARLLDRVKGIDSRKGPPTSYGTPNRKSYTYKVRKALGYSYP